MMPFKKIVVIAFSLLAAVLISACNPSTIRSEQTDNPENILNMLDPEVSSEEQAFAKGEFLLAQGKTEKALFYYVKTLQFNNKNIKALERIAAIHKKDKNPELAIKVYKDILAIDGQNVPANEYLGIYYMENGQVGKAKERLDIVVKNSGDNWKAHNALGVIADLAHNSNEAISHYEAALAIEPANPMLLNNLGYSYYLAGDEIKAKHLLTKALNYDGKYKRAIHNLALIYVKNGSISNAVSLFNRIMPVYDTYNNIGYISMLHGQYAISEEYLKRAIDESPVYFPKAQENLKTLSSLKTQFNPVEPPIDSQSTFGPEVETEASAVPTPSPPENNQSGAERKNEEEAEKQSDAPLKTSHTDKKKPIKRSENKPPPLSYPFSSKGADKNNKPVSKEVKKISVKKTETTRLSPNKKPSNNKNAKSNELKTTPSAQTAKNATQQTIKNTASKPVEAAAPVSSEPSKAATAPKSVPVGSSAAESAAEKPQPPIFIKKAPPKPKYTFDKAPSNGQIPYDTLPSIAPAVPGQSNSKYITDLTAE